MKFFLKLSGGFFLFIQGILAQTGPSETLDATCSAGEADCSSAIVQVYLHQQPKGTSDAVLEYGTDSLFKGPDRITQAIKSFGSENQVYKIRIRNLKETTNYFYRLRLQDPVVGPRYSPMARFKTRTCTRTLSPKQVGILISSCMHPDKFLYGPRLKGNGAKGTPAEEQGFPALQVMQKLEAEAWILNGDNVYYDHNYPPDSLWENRAKSKAELEEKWKMLFSMKAFRQMLGHKATYWLKDDHDFRYDDADLTDTNGYIGVKMFMPLPTARDGIATFREQVPITFPVEQGDTYRMHLFHPDLQIWFLEGRDFRDPKYAPVGPNKSMWGSKQKAWLKQSLLASKSRYKIIVSPGPLVGPDEARKSDNHANPLGYKPEADDFFEFLKANRFDPATTILVCGDRHWAYHSIHPSGFQEFCSGALNDENSRLGIGPGPKSSDPQGLVKQSFSAPTATGSFLYVQYKTGQLGISFFDDEGQLLYEPDGFRIKQ